MLKFPPLRNVSYKFRYHEEECRRRHSVEYLEARKVKIENMIASNEAGGLQYVDSKGNVKDLDSNTLKKELKSIKNSLRKLRNRR